MIRSIATCALLAVALVASIRYQEARTEST